MKTPTASVAAVAHAIARHFTLPQVREETISRTRELCDADGASLLLLDPATGELMFDVVEGDAQHELQGTMRLPKGKGVAGFVATHRQALNLSDVSAHPAFAHEIDEATGFRTSAMLAVPLVVDDKLLGVIETVRGAGREPFSPEHFERLQQLAPYLAIAVHNAQVTDELVRTKERLIATNQQLEHRVRERTDMISKAKREWELTFDSIAEPIALVDQDFTIYRANRSWAKHGGVPVTKIPGSRCYEKFAGRSSPCPNCPLQAKFDQHHTSEVPFGNDRRMTVTAWRMTIERGPVTVVQYHDVTEQRQLETRVNESERMAAVGQLAAGAAHEINNPLAAITANLSLMADEKSKATLDDEERTAMVQESLEAARRVRDVVAAMRDFARTQRDKQEDADVNAPLKRAALAEAPNLKVELTLAADRAVLASPRELEIAFTHLVRNARQASTAEQPIALSTRTVGNNVVVEVVDHGVGIKKEILGRIFEPFFTTRGVGKGMGLGLTSVFAIVRRAGGRVEVKSELGKGSHFTLTFPASGPLLQDVAA